MKTKSRVFSLAMVLLALAMVSSVMLSGTFAKYTTAVAGQDTALVARWSFDVKSGDGTKSISEELNLFDHEYKNFINQKDSAGDFILAPGVNGEFVLKMDYIADVAADIKIETEKLGSADVPIEYSLDNEVSWMELDDLAEELASDIISKQPGASALDEDAPGEDGVFRLAATAVGSTESHKIDRTVKWRWAFDSTEQNGNHAIASNDTNDTKLGEDSQDAAAANTNNRTTYGIKITITADQVAPEPETP